jgi:GMP synthase (glutamine-hydrolysing)
MRKLLVFQHVPFEPLGTLDRMFKDAGFRIRYVNFHRHGDVHVPVERYHGLVVLGGPMAADQTDRYPHLAAEKEAIRHAVDLNMPVLGVCLGAQLMAATLGGRTLRGKTIEYGWTRVTPTRDGDADPLFRHFDGGEPIFQWHADTFTLPPGAVHLASSPACEHQAFRVGEYAYGFQFHLEADSALIRRWLGSRSSSPDHGGVAAQIDADQVLLETSRYIPRAGALARAVFGEFIGRFFSVRRRRAHPSR